eukprot:TRINITY_DN3847_c0_g1_i2.p1 TRINITY_DN3847_c0_g1~~TRINITY_DN3847_c0_g1_i2.p1  ORF type:complete len:436 (+),score=74.47 TRINITY_DN3847_c0_g1_i2:61-1308(+)
MVKLTPSQKNLGIPAHPWVCFIVSNLIVIGGGLFYVFGLYAPSVKSALNFNQKAMNLFGAFAYSGSGLSGYPTTWCYHRFGPRLTMIALGVPLSLSLLGVWAMLEGKIANSVASMAVFFFVLGSAMGGLWLTTIFTNDHNIVEAKKNDSTNTTLYWKVLVSAFLTAAFGLGGTIFTLVYKYVFEAKPIADFMLFQSIALAVTAILGFFFLGLVTNDEEERRLLSQNSLNTEPEDTDRYEPHSRSCFDVLRIVASDYSFWGPYIFFFLGTGIGGTYIGNVGMIVAAIGGDQSDTEYQIIIFSVAQTVSRLIYLAVISHPKIGSHMVNMPLIMMTLPIFMLIASLVVYFHQNSERYSFHYGADCSRLRGYLELVPHFAIFRAHQSIGSKRVCSCCWTSYVCSSLEWHRLWSNHSRVL